MFRKVFDSKVEPCFFGNLLTASVYMSMTVCVCFLCVCVFFVCVCACACVCVRACVGVTLKDGAEVNWWLVGVYSDLKLGGFGWRRRYTHQCQGKTEP